MRVLALIPARSGSKGVKDKNIKPFGGIPLLAHTIQSALKSKICDEVFVCTDSEHYASIAREYGANVPFLRSKESARDESKSIECVIESLEKYKQMGQEFDVLLLLQPTSPLRNERHIRESYELFISHSCESVASVCKVRENPLFMRRLSNSVLSPILSPILMPPSPTSSPSLASSPSIPANSSVRRQDLEEIYRLNGAIYINLISTLTPQTSFNDNKIGYVMSDEDSLDIDCERDFRE